LGVFDKTKQCIVDVMAPAWYRQPEAHASGHEVAWVRDRLIGFVRVRELTQVVVDFVKCISQVSIQAQVGVIVLRVIITYVRTSYVSHLLVDGADLAVLTIEESQSLHLWGEEIYSHCGGLEFP